jgi:pyrrolidone-carboxylate peptidase
MGKTLVTAFGNFLYNNTNSTQEFLKEIPKNKNVIKHVFHVGYFKNDFIRPIKKYKPEKIIFMGMNGNIKSPRFETIAKNEMLTLKNPLYRSVGTIYIYWLKWNDKNLRIRKPINRDILTTIPISKHKPKQIKLKTKPSDFKEIDISKDAGNYVCNYSMWIVENYLRENRIKADFYFIHLPPKLTKSQKRTLLNFIQNRQDQKE